MILSSQSVPYPLFYSDLSELMTVFNYTKQLCHFIIGLDDSS